MKTILVITIVVIASGFGLIKLRSDSDLNISAEAIEGSVSTLAANYNPQPGQMDVKWKQISGPVTAQLGSTTVVPGNPVKVTTVVRELNFPGDYGFEFSVTNSTGHTGRDTSVIHVKPPIYDQLVYFAPNRLAVVSTVNGQADIRITKRFLWIFSQTVYNKSIQAKIGINYADMSSLAPGSYEGTVKLNMKTLNIKFTK